MLRHDSGAIEGPLHWQRIVGFAIGIAVDIALWLWMASKPFAARTRAERGWVDGIPITDFAPHVYQGLAFIFAVTLIGGVLRKLSPTGPIGGPIFFFGLLGSLVLTFFICAGIAAWY